jgi:hypothetical protein
VKSVQSVHFARRLARVPAKAPPKRFLLQKSNSTLAHPGANGGVGLRFKSWIRLFRTGGVHAKRSVTLVTARVPKLH